MTSRDRGSLAERSTRPGTAGRARRRTMLRAFLATPGGVLSLLILVALVGLAVFGPWLLGERAEVRDFALASQGPSKAHPLGTDALGRDLLARTLVATRLSLWMALLATSIGAALGIVAGALLALAPSRIRMVGARGIDGMLAFPSVLMGIFVAAVLGPGKYAAIFGIGIALVPQFARITCTKALTIIGQDYVGSARVMGVKRRRVVARHIVPNLAETLSIVTLVTVGEATIAVSSLSFLGLGVQPPEYDWGQLLTAGIEVFYLTPAAALAPGAMIVLVGIFTGLFGDALAKSANPLLLSRGALRAKGKGAEASKAANVGIAAPTSVIDDTESPGQRPGPAENGQADDRLLQVRGLTVTANNANGPVRLVKGVTFGIDRGEIVGLVGESGSGKTMTALAVAQLLQRNLKVQADDLVFNGKDYARTPRKSDLVMLRERLAVIFQDPVSSFNPLLRIGTQLEEGARGASRRAIRQLALQRMREVRITEPALRLRQFPHELSGGMLQRVMIAMSLMRDPLLIIADEPTASLDVTVQSQIMALLREVNRSHDVALLLISHDIALVSQNCDRIVVMYAGRIVEELPAKQLLSARHPYTRALVASTPSLAGSSDITAAGIPGSPPDPTDPDVGCAFASRCPLVTEQCRTERPPLVPVGSSRVACWNSADPAQPDAFAREGAS